MSVARSANQQHMIRQRSKFLARSSTPLGLRSSTTIAGHLERQVRHFCDAIRCYPAAVRALRHRGNTMRPRKFSVAVATLALLSVPAVSQSNKACVDTKDYVKAVKACSETILSHPNDAAAYHMRGTVLAKNGDTGQAIADYSKAIQLNPTYVPAYNSRAKAFVAKGDYERAWLTRPRQQNYSPRKRSRSKPV